MNAPRVVISTLICAALVACGGSKPKPTPKKVAPKPPEKSAYDKRCEELAAGYAKEVKDKKYLPATLTVHGWNGDEAKSGGKLTESDLVAALKKGGRGVTLLMARGGLGKSKLGWALEAQACGSLAAVRVDLHWDIAANLGKFPAGTNPLLSIVEKRLTGKNSADAKLGVEKALNGRDLLLLFDSLDEVTLGERAKLVDFIQSAMGPIQGTSAVVFTRPPVFSANYGFARVNGRLEIPLLDCDATRRAMRELIKEDAKLANFLEFTKKYGLDRMVVRQAGSCYYPHLSTYRDLIVLRQIAASVAAAPADANAVLASRSKVYEFFLTAAVIKDLAGLKMMPKDLLSLVDRMVLAQNPDGSKRNLGFTVGACLTKTGRTDAQENKQICERLLQSTLFKETNRPDTWQFTNQSIGDLFLARWVNANLVDKTGAPNCKVIAEQANLFESNEVAGFLVGMTNGQACLLPIAQELCSKGSDPDHNFELLDQGLPPGNARVELLKNAQDAAGDALTDATCLGKIMARMKKTVPADAFPEKAAGAMGGKSKTKKRKKRRKKRKK